MSVDPNLGGIPDEARETLTKTGDWLRANLPNGYRFVLFISKFDGSDAAYTSNLDRASAVDVMRELWDVIIATAPTTREEREARELLLTLRALFRKDADKIRRLADGDMSAAQNDPQMIQAMAQFFSIQHALAARAVLDQSSP